MTNEKDNELKRVPIEQFRLVLTHEFFDEKGKKHMLGEPLAICCTNIWSNHASVEWTLNEMMDKMRFEVLKKYARVGETDDE